MRIHSIKWALASSLVLGACGGGPSGAVGDNSALLSGSLGDEAVRQQCVSANAAIVTEDVNGDGNPDIRHVSSQGRRQCSEYDLDFDGAPEVTRFYAEDGQTPVREEHDLDYDGRMDQIAYFEAGALVRKELDTNFNNRIDTWMWCERGRVSRAQRDRRNDGDVDTWETYDDGLLTEASYDDDGDGNAEKWEVFRNGRLIEIRHDTDRDGQPDRAEEIPSDSSGLPEQRIDCELVEREPEAPAAAPGGVAGGAAGAPADGTVPPAEGATAPTGDPITDGLAAEGQ